MKENALTTIEFTFNKHLLEKTDKPYFSINFTTAKSTSGKTIALKFLCKIEIIKNDTKILYLECEDAYNILSSDKISYKDIKQMISDTQDRFKEEIENRTKLKIQKSVLTEDWIIQVFQSVKANNGLN